MHKITGNPENFEHLDVLKKLIKQYVPFAQQKMGFDKPVDINLLSDPENAQNPLGKTAFYDPNMMKITIFVDGRHVKDIMRSLSHEMVHHTQNCQGKFSSGINTGAGYAQDDEYLRKQEKQAYLIGNIRFRDWEDGIKQQQENKKVKNKNLISEIVELIQEEAQKLEEGGEHDCDCDKAQQTCKRCKPDLLEQDFAEGMEEPEQGGCADPNDTYDRETGTCQQNETWFKGNKDQLLFEELTRKWTKR